jgi:hypothetical protein
MEVACMQMNALRHFKTNLIEETEDLAACVLSSRLLVVENSRASCEHDVAELTRWQQVIDPLLHILHLYVESGRDNTHLVDSAIEVDNNLAAAVIVDCLELANVSVLLHNTEELDDNLGAGTDEHLQA